MRNMGADTGLDRIDFGIITALTNDARLSNKELAAKIGLAPSSCLARVRRLVRDGVLTGFHAAVDDRALGIGIEAMLAAKLRDQSQEFFDSLAAELIARDEVLAVYELSGLEDVLIHVVCRDAQHLHAFVSSVRSNKEIPQIVTSLVFQSCTKRTRPNFHA